VPGNSLINTLLTLLRPVILWTFGLALLATILYAAGFAVMLIRNKQPPSLDNFKIYEGLAPLRLASFLRDLLLVSLLAATFVAAPLVLAEDAEPTMAEMYIGFFQASLTALALLAAAALYAAQSLDSRIHTDNSCLDLTLRAALANAGALPRLDWHPGGVLLGLRVIERLAKTPESDFSGELEQARKALDVPLRMFSEQARRELKTVRELLKPLDRSGAQSLLAKRDQVLQDAIALSVSLAARLDLRRRYGRPLLVLAASALSTAWAPLVRSGMDSHHRVGLLGAITVLVSLASIELIIAILRTLHWKPVMPIEMHSLATRWLSIVLKR
jgi:hypothetical protein